MEECVQLQTRISGVDHPDTLSFTKAVIIWRAEADISTLIAEGMDEQGE
jgi:hypothetical protein